MAKNNKNKNKNKPEAEELKNENIPVEETETQVEPEAEEVKNKNVPVEETELQSEPEAEVKTSTGEVKTDEPKVEAPAEPEPSYNLIVVYPFTDKYDRTKKYKIGDKLLNLAKERYDELKAHAVHIVDDLKEDLK